MGKVPSNGIIMGWISIQVARIFGNAFYDEVVCGSGNADSDAEVNLPGWGDVEVGDGEELVLLIVERGAVKDGTGGTVEFDAGFDLPGEVVADFEIRGKDDAVGGTPGTVPGAIERWVERQIIAPGLLVDNGTNLPCP